MIQNEALSIVPGAPDDMDATTRQSLEARSRAFSGWLRRSNRAQAEAIRFLDDCFNRDLAVIFELSRCTRPQDVFGLHTAVVSDLVSGYIAEGKRVFALHRDDERSHRARLDGLTLPAAPSLKSGLPDARRQRADAPGYPPGAFVGAIASRRSMTPALNQVKSKNHAHAHAAP